MINRKDVESFLLLCRQLLLLVLENHSVVNFILLRLDVLEAHALSLGDTLDHLPDVPRTNRMVE